MFSRVGGCQMLGLVTSKTYRGEESPYKRGDHRGGVILHEQ